ncbi:MAG: type IV pilus twitching motility protein PilT, partial [Phycisphaerae bacterium]
MMKTVESILPEGGPAIGDEPQINALLRFMVENEGSDLHLMCGAPAKMRIHGDLHVMLIDGKPLLLTPDLTRGWIYEILDEEHIIAFEQTGDTDLAYRVPGCSRFRVNILEQINGPGAVLRAIPEKILTLEQLGMPEVLTKLAETRQGLVVVTGPTGSGKSTTLAAIINHINHTRGGHIITVE